MAHHIDLYDNSLVIDGFSDGIAQSPYLGTANLQNTNPVTIPGEISAGFSTTNVSSAPAYSNGFSLFAGNSGTTVFYVTSAPALETGQALFVGAAGGTGLSMGTQVYWVSATGTIGGNQVAYLTTTYGSLTQLGVSSTGSGTATAYTFSPYFQRPVGLIHKNYMAKDSADRYYVQDSLGQIWSNAVTTGSTSSWTYTGNILVANNPNAGATWPGSQGANANGNGMSIFQSVNTSATIATQLDEWIFAFRNGQVDYLQVSQLGTISPPSSSWKWVYSWNPATGATNGGTTTQYLTSKNAAIPHEAVVTPDGRFNYCDYYNIGRFYQTSVSTTFDPTTTSTYTYNTYPILPVNDFAQCMAFLGNSLLIGGKRNFIYPWDLIGTQYTNPLILSPESNISSIVTVNNQAFIFCGNRGNIYVTNGSQVSPFAKVPDYLSGTVQPNLIWGGSTFFLGNLYFGVSAFANGTISPLLSNYGGIWRLNLSSKSLDIANVLTSGTAYATTVFGTFPQNPDASAFPGYNLYSSYWDGTNSGIEAPSSNPYSNGTSVIETELIPIGTANKPRNFAQIEYKLSKPLVSGESIQILWRSDLSTSYSSIFTDSTAGNVSNTKPNNFSNVQWVQFKIILTSTSSSPSYVRLKEIRLLGLTSQVS